MKEGGFEYMAVLGAAALGLVLTGPGRLSLDGASGHRLNRDWHPCSPWQRSLRPPPQ